MEWKNHIVSNKEVLARKPIVKGTRLSVEFILGLLANGWKEADILRNYPTLKADDLKAVFAFAQDCLKEGLLFESFRMIDLLADENFPLDSVDLLEEKGFDVLSISRSYKGISDYKIIELANLERRLILTL